mgnify:CR=1 FL=1
MRVAVVGAGPAGVRAVEQLVRAGLHPVWIDEASDGGGRVYQRPPKGFRRDGLSLYGGGMFVRKYGRYMPGGNFTVRSPARYAFDASR